MAKLTRLKLNKLCHSLDLKLKLNKTVVLNLVVIKHNKHTLLKDNLDFCLNELVGQPSSFFLLSMHIYLEAGYNISIGNTPNRGGTGSL